MVVTNKKSCQKCAMLLELYESAERSPRNYWIMTELFVMLHGGDVCQEGNEPPKDLFNGHAIE